MSRRFFRQCERCSGKGRLLHVETGRCWVCNGSGRTSRQRRERLQKAACKAAALDGSVYLLATDDSNWAALRTWGPYTSPCQKILRRTDKYLLIETWWSKGEWFSKKTGWKKGCSVPPEKQRTTWRICPLSLEFIT